MKTPDPSNEANDAPRDESDRFTPTWYNGDNVWELNGKPIRADTIGWYAAKYSDDCGRTWSRECFRLPLRLTACDRGNDFQGKVQIFWGIDKPNVVDGQAGSRTG